ncbi:MAG: type II secretion system major pseudopilin GspG [Gammaproteobacteria bacterium]|nr:type II secretion system major pseudopilin GspG [Gammaproteobacteria bacterium]
MKKLVKNHRASAPKGCRPHAQQGFTLIEIMVVVVIIGLISTLILPNIIGRQEQALEVKAKADIRAISSQLSLYKLDNFAYPNTSEGLQALVTNPGGKKNWRGYLDNLPKDPWDNPYQYLQPGQKNPNSYDLWSFGGDGVAGGEGHAADIGNWEIE